MNATIVKIILSFIIYTYFFCITGNTCYRINEYGHKAITIIPLFTEGIFGHFRSLYLSLKYISFDAFLNYIYNLVFSLNNIFGALILVFYIATIIKINFFSTF